MQSGDLVINFVVRKASSRIVINFISTQEYAVWGGGQGLLYAF